MKSYWFEQRKKMAKSFHRNSQTRTHYQNGILIHHLYSDKNENALSWWDDVGFNINDYKVSVAWNHPRQTFHDQIQNLAFDDVSEVYSKHQANLIEIVEEPIFIAKIGGRAGKAIKLYKQNFLPADGFIEALKKRETEIAASTNFVVTPKLEIFWTKRSRFVSACLPIEVCNENDLLILVAIVKRLIKREVTLAQLFPSYRYTKQHWADEIKERGGKEFHMHAIG